MTHQPAVRWTAKWIWVPDRPAAEPNSYAHFRKTFDLKTDPVQAAARISADSRYMLYVNGRFICRGVPMCDPLYQYYDEVEIGRHLRPGRNVIAVLVHQYGVSTSTYQHGGRSGLLFEADIEGETIASDDSWRTHFDQSNTRDVPRICATHMLQGFQEHFDARKAVDGWQEPEFDDSNWPTASIITHGTNSTPPFDPWPSLVPRDIPHYFEEERPAETIARIGEVTDASLPDNNDLSAKMQAEPMRDLQHGAVETADAMISWDDKYASVTQTAPDSCPSVVIDFGREVTGMPRIDV